MLTGEQRAELEVLGPEIVRTKLIQSGAGPGAALQGFKSAPLGLTRSDVENWLAEKYVLETQERKRTLSWVIVAAWAGIAGVVVGIVGIVVTVWLAKW